MDNSSDPATRLTNIQDQQGLLDPKSQIPSNYKPNKRKRNIRRQVYERFYWLKGEPLRQEAEADWEMSDKEYYQQPETPTSSNDWRSYLQLPDAFSAIQAQQQETIERKSRPILVATEESDEPIQDFCNSVMTYNMNNTDYDYQYALAKLAAGIRGTAFLYDYYRVDKRVVKDPTDVDEEGNLVYQDREVTDFDDDYTEWIPNEFVYIDEKTSDIDNAIDGFRREIINIEEFHRVYDNKPGFFDTKYVVNGGDVSTKSIYKLPNDITGQDVEVLHYYNRAIDAYWVVANNITICDQPLQTKHKELPFAVVYQYRQPGRFWGIGIPKVLHFLSEERKAIRRLNLDRQKITIGGAFLHNSAFDIDDEDTQLYPGRIISVDTNGQPVNNAIVPLNVGDVPASAFKTEEILLEDIHRATGIDDRVLGQNVGGTATEAAILKESALKRVNLISIMNEMHAVKRVGRLKWSNIQFFYPKGRMDKIYEDNEERDEPVERVISVQGKKFSIVTDNGVKSLKMEEVQGASSLTLDKNMAKYLEGSFDITVDADVFTPVSKAIAQTKATELFSLGLSNPATMAVMDIASSYRDVLTINEIKPEKWLKNKVSAKDMQMLAESENMVMSAGQPLGPTKDATEDHTLVHLMFTKTAEFQSSPPQIQQIIMDHILGEHDANPATGQASELMAAHGLAPGDTSAGASGTPTPGMNTPFSNNAQTTQPQAQPADIQATNFAKPE